MFARNPSLALGRARTRWPTGAPLALCVGVLLAMTANDACAAALGSFVTSVGLFAALAAMFAIKGWPAQLPASASALSTAGGALVIAGVAAWWWRARTIERSSGLAGRMVSPDVALAPSDGRTTRPVDIVLPAGLDHEVLLAELRLIFVRLQQAWDTGAMASLRAMTTSDMLEELCLGLSACDHEPAAAGTDVVTLRAELFAFEEMTDAFVASVEFSGLMRESPGVCAAPFRELWMLTKSKDSDSGWKLARHQALL